nr:AbiEi antitoxin N-terminal domain-containing protein [Bradyrhizobium diazoefficiens]
MQIYKLTWQKAVISLQTLLERPLIVGGRTALELQGFSHYLRAEGPTIVYLYGSDAPPRWLFKLPLKERFTFRKSTTLFKADRVTKGLKNFAWNVQNNTGAAADEFQAGPFKQISGEGEWPLIVSSPERALLELLDELPNSESFHQADMLC